MSLLSSLSPDLGLLILRIGIAIVFFAHGIPKIKNVGQVAGFFKQAGIPLPTLGAWLVSLWETVGPFLFVAGLGTRLIGLGYAFSMLVAIWFVKRRMAKAAFTGQGGWELEFALAVAALAVVFTGAGAYSVDAGLGW
jgi:putative oxidoreductase